MVEFGTGLRMSSVPHERLWNNRTMLWLVMTEVCPDGSRPVDVGVTRSARTLRAVERASQCLARIVLQTAHEVVHNLAHHLARGFKSLAGNGSPQRDEIGDQMDICLQCREEFRLEHQGLQVQSLESIFLDNLHNGSREELADIAEPLFYAARRRAKSTSALLLAAVVKGGQSSVQSPITV